MILTAIENLKKSHRFNYRTKQHRQNPGVNQTWSGSFGDDVPRMAGGCTAAGAMLQGQGGSRKLTAHLQRYRQPSDYVRAGLWFGLRRQDPAQLGEIKLMSCWFGVAQLKLPDWSLLSQYAVLQPYFQWHTSDIFTWFGESERSKGVLIRTGHVHSNYTNIETPERWNGCILTI